MIFKADNTAEACADIDSILLLSDELHINDSKERREARSIF